MDNTKQLRIVMQALGVYCIVQSSFGMFAAVSRYIMWRFFDQPPMWAGIRSVLIESLLNSALLLIPAWILLTKADRCARVVADMSQPRNADASEGEEGERINDSM